MNTNYKGNVNTNYNPRLTLGNVNTSKGNVNAPDFEALPVKQQELWLIRARDHLDKTGLSYAENDRDVVLYMTALFLFHIQDYTIHSMVYPCYVVHCIEEGWRFVTDSFAMAHSKFKRAAERGNKLGQNRVALFHWTKDQKCEKRFASAQYPFETDYLPI